MDGIIKTNLINRFIDVRSATESICKPLEIEDYVLQPIADVSPPKWHLGHTTWFFETFILLRLAEGYEAHHPQYNFVFNSYYESVGDRVIRVNRGNLSRPTVSQVYAYRQHVDQAIRKLLEDGTLTQELSDLLELGLNHEQQHQELLLSDIKYILGNNPLFPVYSAGPTVVSPPAASEPVSIGEGVYEIGHDPANGFCFDNELAKHKVYLNDYTISADLISNGEYLEFIEDGGYANFIFWHAEGWDWVRNHQISAPLYWHKIDGTWYEYTLHGLQPLTLEDPVCHVNYYEAYAFASWRGTRLPTEAEWEIASPCLRWGQRWEWTDSAYLPYPGFKKQKGAIGEYNGKFMVSQMVLRGASVATPRGHSRTSYRNFFYPSLQTQFTGIRLIIPNRK
jgi:ergothioneine biosynthesis protein EgtB